MLRWFTFCLGLLILLSSTAGCGDDRERSRGAGDGAGEGEGEGEGRCGTQQSPVQLSVVDVEPAAGSTVENREIVHAFTVEGTSLMLTTFTFMAGMTHTAGQLEPANIQFTITPQGDGMRYSAQPVRWSQAPGHVELTVNNIYRGPDGCHFSLPAPLFSYDLAPPAADADGGIPAEMDGGLPGDGGFDPGFDGSLSGEADGEVM